MKHFGESNAYEKNTNGLTWTTYLVTLVLNSE